MAARDAIDARRIRIGRTTLASVVAAALWGALGLEWFEAWCDATGCSGLDVAALALPVAWGAAAAFIAGRAAWSWSRATWLPGLAFLVWSAWALIFPAASGSLLAGPVMAYLVSADLGIGFLLHGSLLAGAHIGGAWLAGRAVPATGSQMRTEPEAASTQSTTDPTGAAATAGRAPRRAARPMHPAAQGAVAAIITLAVAWALPPVWRFFLIAALLVLTGGIYVGFGLVDGRRSAKAWEGAQAALLIGVVAAATLQPLILAAGWLLHPLWDIAHPGTVHTRVPAWVVPWCLVYDLTLGAATMAWALTGGLSVV